jgi:hypothetical protein
MKKPTPPKARFVNQGALPNTPRGLRIIFSGIFLLGAFLFCVRVGFTPIQIMAGMYLIGSGIMFHGSATDDNAMARTGFGVVIGGLCFLLIVHGLK